MLYSYKQTLAKHPKKRWLIGLFIGLFALVASYVVYAMFFVNASYTPPTKQETISFESFQPTYPSYGSSGVAIANTDVLFSSGPQQQPMASTAKLVTALALLDKLKNTDLNNEYLTISAEDVAITNDYKSKGGSTAAAPLGAKVSYYTALQYMLIVSANNYTDILTQKVFGSMQQYTEAANAYLKNNGIKDTIITDATGFNPATKSTAHDMLRIANIAVSNPVITAITKQKDIVDVSGNVLKSTNLFLPNTSGELIGLKTGFTDEAKAVFLNATRLPNGMTITAVSMRADTPTTSQADSGKLVSDIAKSIKTDQLFKAQEPITTLNLPWGGTADVYTKDDVTIENAASQKIIYTITLNRLDKYTLANNPIGMLSVKSVVSEKSYPVYINDYTPAPLYWRLTHPL